MTELPETALILAAGQGIRLGKRGRVLPKALVEIGGETLISRSVEHLRSAGVRKVVIVTGHLASLIEDIAGQEPDFIRCVHNPKFASNGSLESLHVGLNNVTGPFLLLESDIIYEHRALEALCSCPAPNALLVSGMTGAGDEVFVDSFPVNGTNLLLGLTKMRNQLQNAPLGELVGIFKGDDAMRHNLLVHIEEIHAVNDKADYETGLVRASRDLPVPCVFLQDLVWAEIDDEDMLHRVRQDVYPKLLKAAIR